MNLQSHFLAAVTAFAIVFGAMLTFDQWKNWQADQPWLESTFHVPDFVMGENVTVNYTRNIYRHVTVTWHVEMRDANTHKQVCTAGNTTVLSPKEVRVFPFPFSGLWSEKNRKKPCVYGPGRYYLEFTYSAEGVRDYVAQSNVFEVIPLP